MRNYRLWSRSKLPPHTSISYRCQGAEFYRPHPWQKCARAMNIESVSSSPKEIPPAWISCGLEFYWNSIWALALGFFFHEAVYLFIPSIIFLVFASSANAITRGYRNNGIPACIWPLDNWRATVSLSCAFFLSKNLRRTKVRPFFPRWHGWKNSINATRPHPSLNFARAAIIAALTFNITVEIISGARRH